MYSDMPSEMSLLPTIRTSSGALALTQVSLESHGVLLGISIATPFPPLPSGFAPHAAYVTLAGGLSAAFLQNSVQRVVAPNALWNLFGRHATQTAQYGSV